MTKPNAAKILESFKKSSKGSKVALSESADIVSAVHDVEQRQSRQAIVGGKKKMKESDRYVVAGNSFIPSRKHETVAELPAGIYIPKYSLNGPYFESHAMATDELIRFEDPRHQLVLKEIKEFWTKKNTFQENGLSHKRGMLLSGPPGTGKSCLLKLVMEDIVETGDVVLVCQDAYQIKDAVAALRDVEESRQLLIIAEDIDSISGTHKLLELLDGESQLEGVLVLGTTNYPERLEPRMLRPGRFDRKLEIGQLPKAGREAYFKKKLGTNEAKAATIPEYVELCKDFTFAQMREFLVSTECFGYDPKEAARRIRTGEIEAHKVEESALDAAIAGTPLNEAEENKPDAKPKAAAAAKNLFEKLEQDSENLDEQAQDPSGPAAGAKKLFQTFS